MASYPNRRYEEGKSPIQKRSLNHSCYLNTFVKMKPYIGEDAWEHLKDSSVGVFLKLSTEKYIWSAHIVHYFLTNQLGINSDHEFWSIIGSSPVRFSLHEFQDITGLNCAQFDTSDNWDGDHTQFWEEMQIPTAVGPSLVELKKVLTRCQLWSLEKRVMLGRLIILHVGILGIGHNTRLKLPYAKRVLEPEKFEDYPWGRVGFSSLINSIKVEVDKYNGDSANYTLHGCVHVLLIWAFEAVPGLGEGWGFRRETTRVPLLNWKGCRERFRFEDFIVDERRKHGEVRARYMLPVESLENAYPDWIDDDGEQSRDPRLHKLIEDIHQDCLNPNGWPWSVACALREKRKKRKREEKEKEAEKEGPLLLLDFAVSGSKKTKSNEDAEDSGMLGAITKMVEDAVNKVEARLTSGYTTLYASLDARLGCLEKQVEKLVELITETNKFDRKQDAKASCAPQKKTGEEPEYVVNLQDPEEKMYKKLQDTDIEDVTTQQNKMASSSESMEDNALQGVDSQMVVHEATEDTVLQGLGKELVVHGDNIKAVTPVVKRVPKSNEADARRWETLKKKLEELEEHPIESFNSQLEFWNVLTLPRKLWPDPTYGWLHDEHIEAALTMFRQRSIHDPSPYRERVGFLNYWYVRQMVNDFKSGFQPGKFLFDGIYFDEFYGHWPAHAHNNKRWYYDIDNLYAVVNVKSQHWIALDINLPNKKILVYDSIPSVAKEDEILEAVKPFRCMFPSLLNVFVEKHVRKGSKAQFDVRRLKNDANHIPYNKNPGDCGVYSLKFIECLALGCKFDGLNDESMQRIREKLAVDMYNEVEEAGRTFQMTAPLPRGAERENSC